MEKAPPGELQEAGKIQGTSELPAGWNRVWWKDGAGPGSKRESQRGFNWGVTGSNRWHSGNSSWSGDSGTKGAVLGTREQANQWCKPQKSVDC